MPRREIQKMFEATQLKTPRVFMHQMDNENSFGDYLYHSKNCYWCFDSYSCEDSIYVFNATLERGAKDSLDCGPMGNTMERSYDCSFCGYIYDSNHICWCDYLNNCAWCVNMFDSNHCFGCAYVKNKEYMILNKSVSKNEYEKTTTRLNKELAAMGVRDLYGLINFTPAPPI